MHSAVWAAGASALLSLTGQALAACTVNSGVSATANAGDTCSIAGSSFVNSGTAVSASGGATMNLTASSVTARATSGFGIDISGATLNANDLTASGGGATNARAIAGRAGSVLTVNGDLTATRVGGGTLGAAVDIAGAGSVMTVTGKSTITSTVAADGVRSTAGSQIFFNGDTSITTVNTAVVSQTSGSLLGTGVTGSSLVQFGGNVVAKSTGAAGGFVASGNLDTGNRIVVVGNADVSTTAANGGPAMTASAGGSIRVGGTTTASTVGTGANGMVATGGGSKIMLGGAANITTTGAGASGVVASGTGAMVSFDQGATVNVNSGVGLAALAGGQIVGRGLVTVNGVNWNSADVDGGVIATGTGSSIQLGDVTVQSAGASSSSGIGVRQGGSVQVSGVAQVSLGAGDYLTPIDTQGDGSSIALGTSTAVNLVGSATGGAGVAAEQGAGRITAAGPLSVRTEGSWGIFATTGSNIELKNINVQVGVDVNGDNALAGQNHPSSAAVYVSQQGNISFENATVSNALWRGLYAQGSGNPSVAATITGTGHADITTVLDAGGGRTGTADAVRAQAAGAKITLGSVTTRTTGAQSSGLRATDGGVIELTGGTGRNNDIVTSGGSQGYGIEAQGAGSSVTIQGADTTVRTSGAESFGVVASGGATVTATNLSVETTGLSSDGVRVASGSAVVATGAMNVNVAGGSGAACSQGVAICVIGDGSALSGGSTAAATSSLQSTGTTVRMESGANMAATLNNAVLSTSGVGVDLMSVSGATGSSTLNLHNSTVTAGTGGLLLNVTNGSTFAFANDRTTLTGDIKASADSTVNMTLTNGSFLTGRIDPVNLTIDASSRWDVTGDSLLGTLRHAGTINILPGVGGLGGTYKTVTVANYVGSGGRINLNTYLGSDSSPSDKLVIDGGTASGNTTLGITNAGGGGAPTGGKGIQVVQATGGATTATSAFSLAAPVSAGAYDYSLVRNVDESWYLTSALVPPPPPGPPSPPGPPAPPAQPASAPASLPNYRQETSLYAAVPSLAALHSAATMDSFHERLGAAGYAAGEGGQPARLWVRVLGSNGERRGDAMGIYGRNGPSYDHKTAALQLGGDFYQGRNDDGTRTHAGLYVATGQTTGDVQHVNGTRAGSAKLDVTSLGLYWSVLGEQGGYVDFVAQGSHYGVKATSTRMPAVKTSGSGYDVSVEGGWPFALGGAWTLEPQVQVRLQQADLGSGADLAGRVDYGDADSLVGRAGLKLGYTSARIAAWTRLDLLNEFKGRSTTTVSSLAGLYGVGFDSSVHGRSAALTVGVDAKLTQAVSLYGSASYRRALGDSRGHAWGAQAGVKVAW